MNGEPRTSNDTESARADKPRVYDLEERLLEFSVQIIEVSEALPKTRAGNHIAAKAKGRAKMVWENLTNSAHFRMTENIEP